MKKLVIIPIVFIGFRVYSQNIPQPFSSINKEVEILTLSAGKYDEFFENDTVERIGSVMFNTVTNKIEYILNESDSISYQPTETSRFLSVDPLENKYPELSPYVFVGNNPISNIDPDGREIVASKDFLASEWGKVYLKMQNSNSVYTSLIEKFAGKQTDYNFKLYYGYKTLTVAGSAITISTEYQNGSTFVTEGVNSDSYYSSKNMSKSEVVTEGNETYTVNYKLSEIYMAYGLLHEALHVRIAGSGQKKLDEKNHEFFADYQGKILKGLKEYNTDNKLGYSDTQLEQLSWDGLSGSQNFKDYITKTATDQSITYDQAYSNWWNNVQQVKWKESSNTKKTKEAAADSTGTN